MSSNLQWEPNWHGLRQRFRLVAAELWGHGASPVPDDVRRYTVNAYLDEFERIRRGLEIDRWVVCGQSFGAGIMLRYAYSYPDRVKGAIITNSRSALSESLSNGTGGRSLKDWEEIDTRTLPFHPRHAKRFPAHLKQRMERSADVMLPRALWQATETTGRDLSCRYIVADLPQPLLLVNGQWEKAFQPDRDFAERTVENIQIADLDAGHSVNIEAAEAFNAAVIEFVSNCW